MSESSLSRFVYLLCIVSAVLTTDCGGTSTAPPPVAEQPANPLPTGAPQALREVSPPDQNPPQNSTPSQPMQPASAQSGFQEGKDYTILERHVFNDEMGFDQPVEAFSMLFPKGWKIQGGVRWLGLNQCRAEITSFIVKAQSPDGAVAFEMLPVRSFDWANEPILRQSMQLGAERGGCGYNEPFDAKRYIAGFAQRDLKAQASDIRDDHSYDESNRKFGEQADSIARQYGNDSKTTSSRAFGTISWPDGTQGILQAGVMSNLGRQRNAVNGQIMATATTQVTASMIRYPAARRDEAAKLFGMISSSLRVNPIWSQAKTKFLNDIGQKEHAGRMDRIRLAGEQSKAYARAANQASDRQMRSWENQQSSQDRSHTRFVQTIREVETWQGAEGPVELSSGYKQAWTRGNGRYILSNNPNFDPSRVLQDQQWQPMKRADP